METARSGFLVISNLVDNAVLVYDTVRDEIFSMDFEGGDELLKQDRLEPEFRSFQEFIRWHFGDD